MSKKSTVIVRSPSHKCSIDFKVRGRLEDRTIKTIKYALGSEPVLAVRIGNSWKPVTRVTDSIVSLLVPRGTDVPGLR